MMGLLNEMAIGLEAAATAPPPAAPTSAPAPDPEPAAAPSPEPEPIIQVEPAPAEPAVVSISADRAMKVADQLELILKSLKMGCVAGNVLDTMTEAKAEIMKIVPSDPIMVKMDKWAGTVSAYPKRKELQARDILKLKKDLKAEIPKYRPA
jgi:hypothetical protein